MSLYILVVIIVIVIFFMSFIESYHFKHSPKSVYTNYFLFSLCYYSTTLLNAFDILDFEQEILPSLNWMSKSINWYVPILKNVLISTLLLMPRHATVPSVWLISVWNLKNYLTVVAAPWQSQTKVQMGVHRLTNVGDVKVTVTTIMTVQVI